MTKSQQLFAELAAFDPYGDPELLARQVGADRSRYLLWRFVEGADFHKELDWTIERMTSYIQLLCSVYLRCCSTPSNADLAVWKDTFARQVRTLLYVGRFELALSLAKTCEFEPADWMMVYDDCCLLVGFHDDTSDNRWVRLSGIRRVFESLDLGKLYYDVRFLINLAEVLGEFQETDRVQVFRILRLMEFSTELYFLEVVRAAVAGTAVHAHGIQYLFDYFDPARE